jgi:hypothetical protein
MMYGYNVGERSGAASRVVSLLVAILPTNPCKQDPEIVLGTPDGPGYLQED